MALFADLDQALVAADDAGTREHEHIVRLARRTLHFLNTDDVVTSAEQAAADTETFRWLRRSWRAAYETLRVHSQNEEEMVATAGSAPLAAPRTRTSTPPMTAESESSSAGVSRADASFRERG